MAAVAHLGGLMPKRWLEPRTRSSPARWAVGCHECGAEISFTGETSIVQASVWYNEHFCPEEPRDDLAYLTLPSLDMTGEQLLRWARGNPSISAKWVLEHLGECDRGHGDEPTKERRRDEDDDLHNDPWPHLLPIRTHSTRR